MSKLAVVGSRDYDEKSVIELLGLIGADVEHNTIVSGGAKGADSGGRSYALHTDMQYIEFLPDWDKHGKAAGYIRNKLIIEEADCCIAFWDGKSKGTRHSIDLCLDMGKPLTVVVNGRLV
jgi:hypothetical protein